MTELALEVEPVVSAIRPRDDLDSADDRVDVCRPRTLAAREQRDLQAAVRDLDVRELQPSGAAERGLVDVIEVADVLVDDFALERDLKVPLGAAAFDEPEPDRVRAVGDRKVVHVLDADELGWNTAAGESVELRVRRAGADRLLVLQPEWTPRTEPYIYLVIVGLAFLLSGSFIALRWPGIRGGLIYACFAGCVFVHLTVSPVGRADALDWTFGWGSDAAGLLWPALLHWLIHRRLLEFCVT